MDQFEYMVTTYSSDTCKRLGVEGVDLYGGTRHSSARALLKKYSPDEIKRYGTLHRTNRAFERYLGEVDRFDTVSGRGSGSQVIDIIGHYWSGRADLNRRPRAPKARALARLRYVPVDI